jgi:tRNA-splicing ligase RtcB (3'-phosphate/5'-hydroxy nucleic acid ligase)
MSYETIETEQVPIKAWTCGVPIEEQAKEQLRNVAALPFIYKHLAVMPDVHWGKGATVGSVIATKDAIVPAAVGVDIGCGMVAAMTDLAAADLPDNLGGVRTAIEKAVPHGRTDRGGRNDRGAWGSPQPFLARPPVTALTSKLSVIADKHPKLSRAAERARAHLGTLGTGNHFIELCLDEADRVWVMLHSGSRGIGNAIGSYFIERAKEDMRRQGIDLPDRDLAYLTEGAQDFADYVEAVGWAQDFARANRELMLEATIAAVSSALGRPVKAGTVAVNCHHNYIAREAHFGEAVLVTRKGAVRAGRGELGIIPGSMGAKSFIVRGLGNPESFESCSHGAGRALSRGAAKKQITLEQHIAATAHVECRKDADVIDESPAAYKDIDAVMAAQSDLVEVVHTLRQVVCVKG